MSQSSRGVEAALQAGEPIHRSLVGLYGAAIFVWALDFKAAASGQAAAFQAVLLLAYMVLLGRITAAALRRGASLAPLWALILATIVFLIDSALTGMIRDQPAYSILVNLIPPFIYVSTSVITYLTLVSARMDLPAFLNVLRAACLAFAVCRLVTVSWEAGGIDPSTSRWQILSGAVVPSLALGAVSLVQRLSLLDVLVLLSSLLVGLLSVTRTIFVALGAQLVSVFLSRPGSVFKSSTIQGLVLLAVAMLLVFGIDHSAGTGLLERWASRLAMPHGLAGDPTALTRSAETKYMLQSFAQSTATVAFGNGLAAETSLIGPDASRAAHLVGWESVRIHSIGYGHESYASILFVAGVFGGGGLLVLQFLNGMQALSLLRQVQQRQSMDASAHVAVWGALIVVGMIAIGFLSGVLGDRSTCVWYGIGTGMLYWARETLKKTA